MSRLAWMLGSMAKTTAKGAAITLTSTVVSCGLACYIEIGGHRLVYRYFPHRYANVTHANGLTQEQLEAVRVHKIVEQNNIDTASEEQQQSLGPRNMFWKEEKQESSSFLQDFLLPSQEVIACSMEG